MKLKYIVLIISVCLSVCFFCRTEPQVEPQVKLHVEPQLDSNALFIVCQNDKYGFINYNGEIVIDIKYRMAYEFSEGLSNVRLNGTYGYINKLGEMVIESRFDYATPFNDGVAIVYEKGNPFCIDKLGNKKFEHSFKEINAFAQGRSLVKSTSGKLGYIDREGTLLIDTIYDRIGDFKKGLAVVVNNKSKKSKYETGVIDSTGKIIIPLGKYSNIE